MDPSHRISTPAPALPTSSTAQVGGYASSSTMTAPSGRPSRPSTPIPAAAGGQPILPLTPSALFASSAPLGQPTTSRASASSSRQGSFYDGHYRGGTASSSYKASSSRLSSWVSAPWLEDFPRTGAPLSTQLTEPTLPLPRAPSRAGQRQTARAPASGLHRSHSSSALPQQVFWTAVPPVLPSSASSASASASSARHVQDRERQHDQGRTTPARGSAPEGAGERSSFLTRMFDRSRQDAESMVWPSSPSLDASSPPEGTTLVESSPYDGATSRNRETDQLLPSRKRGKETRPYVVKSAASPRSYGSLDPYVGDRFSAFTSSSSSSSSPMDPMRPWPNGRPVPLTTGRLLALALLLAALASAIILVVLVVYSSTHTVSDLRAHVRGVSLLERASDNSTMGMELVLQLTAQNPNRLGPIDLTPSAPLSVALVRETKVVAILDPVFPDMAPPPPPSSHVRRPHLRNTPCHHAPYVSPSNLGDLGALHLYHATDASQILHVPSGGNVAVHVRGRTRPEATSAAPLWAAYVNQSHHGTRWYLWIHGSYTAYGVLALPRTVPVCEAIVLPKAVDLPRHLLDGQLLVL
ncbi:hypothetical protein AMAG_01940 [Allomyces macrogynus ATCC 38327]|uniref:Uncharacterized protein n=1 Tax=Allomyces macrogynus (strain ATCC 38327) TaxID=578462 RepID=A0A0L0S0M4_ALLM3|nr:hypothetical protein AMAG_01940 [Allomyces macrogynus ATCC 38327]|eukprot:KNE56098.1 hypothetical protein AMAG_01940 [Allomyces macrogynus ATCC 38327]